MTRRETIILLRAAALFILDIINLDVTEWSLTRCVKENDNPSLLPESTYFTSPTGV